MSYYDNHANPITINSAFSTVTKINLGRPPTIVPQSHRPRWAVGTNVWVYEPHLLVMKKFTLIRQQRKERMRTHPHEELDPDQTTNEPEWKEAFIIGLTSAGDYVTRRHGTETTPPRIHHWNELRRGSHNHSRPMNALDELQTMDHRGNPLPTEHSSKQGTTITTTSTESDYIRLIGKPDFPGPSSRWDNGYGDDFNGAWPHGYQPYTQQHR
jgi:hypothetical protein